MSKGLIIASFGIPGSGKSSTTRELEKLIKCTAFYEPEEPLWGDAVKMRHEIGDFTSVMWFRSQRVPLLYKAQSIKFSGMIALTDFYYDKLFYTYINKPGIEWFIDRNDYYYNELVNIAKKDYDTLPDSDILIFYRLDENCWKSFIKKRNREMDQEDDFQKSFILQETLLSVAKEYCKTHNCKLLIHEEKYSSPKEEARIIYEELIRNNYV